MRLICIKISHYTIKDNYNNTYKAIYNNIIIINTNTITNI